jgi:hypothetical protein
MMKDLCNAVNELVFNPVVELIVPIYKLILYSSLYVYLLYNIISSTKLKFFK